MDEVVPAIEEVVDLPDPPGINSKDLALTWIGFDAEATRNRIQVEGFASFDNLKSMKEKDVRDLAESYGRRTTTDGRFIFGVRRTQNLIGLINWVQDFVRIGEIPTLAEFGADRATFCTALETASNRDDV
jgi:hypothetical protein